VDACGRGSISWHHGESLEAGIYNIVRWSQRELELLYVYIVQQIWSTFPHHGMACRIMRGAEPTTEFQLDTPPTGSWKLDCTLWCALLLSFVAVESSAVDCVAI
jgi:hypothetical protein